MNGEELNELLIENIRMRKALLRIEKWDLPKVKSLDGNSLVSYECSHGSNGAREYARQIARTALDMT